MVGTMQRWKVTGANRQTGETTEIIVEAATESDAVKKAGATGMLISEVVREGPPAMPQATPAITPPLAYAMPTTPPPKKRTYGLGTLLLICLGGCCLLGVLVPKKGGSVSSPSRSTGASTPAATPQPSNDPKGFSAWDGSHIQLTKMVKASLHDPGSFEHVSTKFWDMKTHYVVRMEYRAKNGFGALRLGWVKAKCDKEGNVTEIMESSE